MRYMATREQAWAKIGPGSVVSVEKVCDKWAVMVFNSTLRELNFSLNKVYDSQEEAETHLVSIMDRAGVRIEEVEMPDEDMPERRSLSVLFQWLNKTTFEMLKHCNKYAATKAADCEKCPIFDVIKQDTTGRPFCTPICEMIWLRMKLKSYLTQHRLDGERID